MKIRKLIEAFEDIEFEELKAELTELTSNNYHTEAMMLLADKYAPELSSQLAKFKDGNLSIEQAEERHKIFHELLQKLKSQFDKNHFKQIVACL